MPFYRYADSLHTEDDNNYSDSIFIKENLWTLTNPKLSTIDGKKNKKELKKLLNIF